MRSKVLAKTARKVVSTANRPPQAAGPFCGVCLLGVIGVDGMSQKNADAKNPDQYCCDLDHSTHPYAQPALLTDTQIGAGWFQNDFVRS